jgi:tetratricopeptide (TPR) repeat protein
MARQLLLWSGRVQASRRVAAAALPGVEKNAMSNAVAYRTVRQLAAAEGYLELGMAGHALETLNAISDAGPYEAISELLKGEAFKAQSRYDEAIQPLHRAAEMFPAPYCNRAWRALSECYRASGHKELAEAADKAATICMIAAGIEPESVELKPIFTVTVKFGREPAEQTEEQPHDAE